MYKQTYKAGIPRSDASQNPCCSISRHTKLFSPQKPHYSKDFLYCINRVKKKYMYYKERTLFNLYTHPMHKSWSSLKALENMLFMKKGDIFLLSSQ